MKNFGEDKIRITLNIEDLHEKNIDYQSFMSNSIESQKIFLDMLEKAEKEIGFTTRDYKIMIEALATSDGYFILTITRSLPEEDLKRKKLSIKRKNVAIKDKQAIYSFNSFDDFCEFCKFIDSSIIDNLNKLSKNFSLYLYNNTYYLVIDNLDLDFKYLKNFYSSITEFAKFVHNSEIFYSKLTEYGQIIIKDKAIKTCIKHFISK